MSFVSAGDVFKLGQGAFKLWELGFSKCKNAERQYHDFGVDIQYLSQNLQKLGKVIQDANKYVPTSTSISPDERLWDLKSLVKICGDFRKTIGECETLLGNRNKFARGRGGFVYNLQWNLTIEPEVRRLKDRVVFHNIKILTVLQPLQTKLMQDLMQDLKDDIRSMHGDLASRVTELHQYLQEIERKLDRQTAINGQNASANTAIVSRVPDYLVIRFELAAKESNSTLVDEKAFPFYASINAFHHHYDQSTVLFKPKVTPMGDFFAERTPEPIQYVNLMKSIWIIQRIKKGSEWAEASSDLLSKCYMEELEGKCLHEYIRFTTRTEPQVRLKEPDQGNISLLRVEEFRIWLGDDEESESHSTADYLDEILHVPLTSPSRHRKQELVLFRRSDTKLQVRTVSSKITGTTDREVVMDYIDLSCAYLLPIYANPSSSDVLNVSFRGNDSAGEPTALSFLKLKDLLDFQQAITSYRVVFDMPDIQTSLLIASGYIGRGKPIEETGRIQIWAPRRLEKRSPQRQPSGVASPLHQGSEFSDSSNTLSVKIFSTAHTSPVMDENTMSWSFQLPELPILVLYLKGAKSNKSKTGAKDDSGQDDEMSYLTIQMDKKTMVSKIKCGCNRNTQICKHSTISRSDPLLAQRITAKGRQSANLALLGMYRAPNPPVFERKMKWLHIDFAGQDEQQGFEKAFEEAKAIYEEKMSCYYADMKRAKQGLIKEPSFNMRSMVARQ